MRQKKMKLKRSFVLRLIISFSFLFIVGVLFKVQIIDMDIYSTTNRIVKIDNVVVDSARGDILDRNGNPIVTNIQVNSLVFNAAFFPDAKNHQKDRNKIVNNLIKLFRDNGKEYIDELPILLDGNGEFVFNKQQEKDIKYLKSKDVLNLNDYATAQNCMDELVSRYSLEKYTKKEQRDIASVLIQMKKECFSKRYPYTFAKDVPTTLIAKVMESSDFYKGVEVNIEANRFYTQGDLAPHVIGRTAPIDEKTYKEKKQEYKQLNEKLQKQNASQEEIDNLERNKYNITDSYGQFGIENYAEKYLRGTRGVKTVTVDTKGKIGESYTVEPTQGDTVVLTIDKNLQNVAQDALKSKVDSIKAETGDPCAAAVVAIDVHTGEILACASYPSYDISTYSQDYSKLAKDPRAPLWNRALKSTYQPGSTFKPLVAIAALENGTINKDTIVKCKRLYTYFEGRPFKCLSSHGPLSVVKAIQESCNIFFYETGRRLGINMMDNYASRFGLGQATGVEIPEASGVLASIEYRESKGKRWQGGDTVQAAIGQSDHLFTPIQLANYVATIANGGTRYVPHFIKSIKSADLSKTKVDKQPQVATETGVSSKNMNIVKEGMLRVTTRGYCRKWFDHLPIKVGAKTGTSTVVQKINGVLVDSTNGFFVSFAPYENPEIAVGIVVETAKSGGSTSSIATSIYDYYFSNKGVKQVQQSNQLLS